MTVWTIHKVNNETPKGTRSYENLPYTIEYNLDDYESVLCVYFVYEGLKFSGWVADDCKNETVVHLVLCTDKSYGITGNITSNQFYFYKCIIKIVTVYCYCLIVSKVTGL